MASSSSPSAVVHCARTSSSSPSSLSAPRRAPASASLVSVGRQRQRRGAAVVAAALGDMRPAIDENPEGVLSGEWPDNFSLVSYDDFRAYLQSQQQQDAQAGDQQRVALLREAMSTPVLMVTAEQTLEEVQGHFQVVSGLPVVDSARRCVGVVVKSDQPKTKIAQVMTSPAITLSCDKTVTDAAALMLKKKIHRLPIVNQDNQVIGIVTRDDVLRALEAMLKI